MIYWYCTNVVCLVLLLQGRGSANQNLDYQFLAILENSVDKVNNPVFPNKKLVDHEYTIFYWNDNVKLISVVLLFVLEF